MTIKQHIDQYIASINQYLDMIPIIELNDFDLAIQLLNNLLNNDIEKLNSWITENEYEYDDNNVNNNNNNINNNNKQNHKLKSMFQNGIKDLGEMIISPEMYVKPSEFDEFRSLVQKRIREKITEFNKYLELKNLTYINDFQKKIANAKNTQSKLKGYVAPKPGDEKHALSEGQWLQAEALRFHQEENRLNALFGTILDPNQLNMILSKPGLWRYFFCENAQLIKNYVETFRSNFINYLLLLDTKQLEDQIPRAQVELDFGYQLPSYQIDEFLALNGSTKSILLENKNNCKSLLNIEIKFSELNQLKPQILEVLIENKTLIELLCLRPSNYSASSYDNNNNLESNTFIFNLKNISDLIEAIGVDEINDHNYKIRWLAEHTQSFISLIFNNEFRNLYFKNFSKFYTIEKFITKEDLRKILEDPSRFKINLTLAELCYKFERSQSEFERLLSLVQHNLKSFDFLPDITISGADIDANLSTFTFSKLPVNDLRGFFLGEYTACDQSFGKPRETRAVHGMTSHYSGFYVLYEKDEIVAQTWAWIGPNGELVFNSWEYVNHSSHGHLCPLFLDKAIKLLNKHGFSKILLGINGCTPSLSLPIEESFTKIPGEHNYGSRHKRYILCANPPISILTKFKEFAQRNNLEIAKFSHLFESEINNATFLNELSNLILNEQLSFEEFFNLIVFKYINNQEILHEACDAGHQLSAIAFKFYGPKMRLLFQIKSKKNISLFEIMCKYDDVNLLQAMINILSQAQAETLLSSSTEEIDRFITFAVKYDAVQVLNYLYENYYSSMKIDEFAQLKAQNGISLLYNATDEKCLNYLLSKMNKNKEELILMFNLVREKTIKMDSVGTLKILRQMYDTEEDWLNYLVTKDGYSQSLHCAIMMKSYRCVRYIINSLNNNFDHLHKLFCTPGFQNRALLWLSYKYSPTELEYLIREMLLIYKFNHKEFAKALYLMEFFEYNGMEKYRVISHSESFEVFDKIICSKNIKLLDDLMLYFSEDSKVYNQLLSNDLNGKNLLTKMVYCLDFHKYYNDKIYINYSFEEKQQFYEALLSRCSHDQLKSLLLADRRNYIRYFSPESVRYFINKIPEIDQGQFEKQWASLDENGPIYKWICERSLENSDTESTNLWIQYYIKVHGKVNLDEFLLNNMKDMIIAILDFKDITLLEYIYPLIKNNEQMLNELYNRLYTRMTREKENISLLAIFEWVISQNEIPHDRLMNFFIGLAKYNEMLWRDDILSNLAIVLLLWNKYIKRLDDQQLLSIILACSRALHIKHALICKKQEIRTEEIEQRNAIINMLDAMLKHVIKMNDSCMSLLSVRNGSGLFRVSCLDHCMASMKIILHNCNSDERLELLEEFNNGCKQKQQTLSAEQVKFIQKAECYLELLTKFETLMQLKKELQAFRRMSVGMLSLFKDCKCERILLEILNHVNDNQLLSFDDSNQSRITEEINNLWEKTYSELHNKLSDQTTTSQNYYFIMICQRYYSAMMPKNNNRIAPQNYL